MRGIPGRLSKMASSSVFSDGIHELWKALSVTSIIFENKPTLKMIDTDTTNKFAEL